MRTVRAVVVGVLVLKVVVLGTWWWDRAWAAKEGACSEPAGTTPVPPDVLAKSRGFRELLDGVRQRGADLDQREQAIAARESALKTLEKTLADEVTHLEGLAKAGGVPLPAGAPGAAADAAPAGAAGGVTKVYESMKPDEAGPIFDKLDDQVALGILRRMKERQIGAILAAMNRDRAVVMTRLLADAGIVPR